MKSPVLLLLGTLLLLLGAGRGLSAPPAPVSFSRQILPSLQADCFSCHSGATPASGYSMANREALLKGGRHGVAILVGKGSQSSLVRYLTGANKPQMPPGIAWDMDRVALVRRWIDEGAKVDSYTPALKMPKSNTPSKTANRQEANLLAPVTALAYSPNGDFVAVGGYKVVRLLDSNTKSLSKTLQGLKGQVMATGWTSDGEIFAAAGGEEGVIGEILLWETHTWKRIGSLEGHKEVVYSLSWRPNSHELATGSLDKSVRIWDADKRVCTRTLKDHADYVTCVAYSQDGKMLATSSADRSVKAYDTQNWKRLFTLNAHNDVVTSIALHPNGKLLATSSTDKTVKIWTIKPGGMENPDRTLYEAETIPVCSFSPTGDHLLYGAGDQKIKVYNGEGTQFQKELAGAKEGVFAMSLSPNGQTLVAGAFFGTAYFWNATDGKLLQTYVTSEGKRRASAP